MHLFPDPREEANVQASAAAPLDHAFGLCDSRFADHSSDPKSRGAVGSFW